MFQVYERETNKPIGNPLKTREAARKKVDKLDNAYGSYHYYYKEV